MSVQSSSISIDAAIQRWHQAWDTVLESNRTFWQDLSGLPFRYSAKAPTATYDPSTMPSRRVGSFIRMTFAENIFEDVLAEGRQSTNLVQARQSNLLMEDPDDDQYLILIDRWPKTRYHSLLVPRAQKHHNLTSEIVRAELRWVRRGAVAEFHSRNQIIQDLHVHLYPRSELPLLVDMDRGTELDRCRDVALVELNIGFPHIAFSSPDPRILENANASLGEQLVIHEKWFNQNAFFSTKNGEYVTYFALWDKGKVEKRTALSFNTCGLLRVPDASDSDEVALERLSQTWESQEQVNEMRARFWSHWTRTCVSSLAQK